MHRTGPEKYTSIKHLYIDINVKTVVVKKVEVKAGKKFFEQDSLLSNTFII